MFTPRAKLRSAGVSAIAAMALFSVGTSTADAAGWPPLQEGAFLYSGTTGSGTVTQVDLSDLGTCHTLTLPARSVQVVSGSASLELYPDAGCTGASWRTGSLAQNNLPWAMVSYRVVPS